MLKRIFASKKRPCFRSLGPCETRTFDLSGCKLEVTLPPHDYEFPEDDSGSRFNIFDPNIYSYNVRENKSGVEVGVEGITFPSVFLRKWDSYGSIFHADPIGSLQCSLVIFDVSPMGLDFSCFDKAQMERLLIHDLYYSEGPGSGSKNEYDAPLNWEIKKINKVEWVYYEYKPRKPDWLKESFFLKSAQFTSLLATPLFDDKYILFSFSSINSSLAESCSRLMRDRIDRVISTIKLVLPSDACSQKSDAVKKNLNAEYSVSREIEPWRYYGSWREGDLMAGEKEIVFEGECSPPPRFS